MWYWWGRERDGIISDYVIVLVCFYCRSSLHFDQFELQASREHNLNSIKLEYKTITHEKQVDGDPWVERGKEIKVAMLAC